GAGLLGDLRLASVGDVHDDAPLKHFGKAGLEAKAGGATVVLGHGLTLFVMRLGAGTRSLRDSILQGKELIHHAGHEVSGASGRNRLVGPRGAGSRRAHLSDRGKALPEPE